jgi:hypothetical protein
MTYVCDPIACLWRDNVGGVEAMAYVCDPIACLWRDNVGGVEAMAYVCDPISCLSRLSTNGTPLSPVHLSYWFHRVSWRTH